MRDFQQKLQSLEAHGAGRPELEKCAAVTSSLLARLDLVVEMK